MKIRNTFLIGMVLVLLSLSLSAQWTQTNGPFGGTVNCLATNGSSIFAGTLKGVYKSADNGISWTEANYGITNYKVLSLAADSDYIYAGTEGGVFFSSNNGASWTAINNGITNLNVWALKIVGNNVFAGTAGGGVFLSSNQGGNWSSVNSGLTNLNILSIVNIGADLFVGTAGDGVFHSTNNGNSWTVASTGLSNSFVYSLAVANNNLIAGTGGGGVFSSANNGANWTSMNTGLTNLNIYSIAANDTLMYAASNGGGVFYSTDNGVNWLATNNGITNLNINTIIINGLNVIAGTDGAGIFQLIIGQSNWIEINNGIIASTVNVVAVSGSNIFAGSNGGGVLLSSNAGNTWSSINNGLTNPYILSFGVNGMFTFAGSRGGGVFVRFLGGSWTPTNNGLTNLTINTIAVGQTGVIAGTDNGVFLSTNNGTNWTLISSGLFYNHINSLVWIGNNIYAATQGGGIYYTTNNGVTWATLNNGITNLFVKTLAINGTNFFAGTDGGGIFHSSNSGSSWSVANSGLTNTNVNTISITGSNILAGTNGGGVFLSTNNGTNWNQVNTGLPNYSVNRSFAFSNNVVFTGINTGGVWKRTMAEIVCGLNPPIVTSASSSSLCSGSTVNIPLSANVPSYFNWIASNNPSTSGESTTQQTTNTINNTITNVSTSPQNVLYTITPFTISGGCAGTPQLVSVTVNPAPTIINLPDSIFICTGDTLNMLPISTVGSTYSWFANDNPNVTGESTTLNSSNILDDILINTSDSVQVVNYSIVPTAVIGACPGAQQLISVVVNPMDNPNFNYQTSTFCQTGVNPSAIIDLPGGFFSSSPVGLAFLDTSIGFINLATSALGTYSLSYQTAGVCPSTSTIGITITSSPLASFAYFDNSYCIGEANPNPIYNSGGSAGIFSASPAGLIFVNNNTGKIDLTNSASGSYWIKNLIAAQGGCAQSVDSFYVSINALPVVSFSGLDSNSCSNSSSGLTGIPSGGLFNGNGITGNVFNAAIAGVGLHNISYQYTDNNGCMNSSVQTTFVLPPPPAPEICVVTADSAYGSYYNFIYWDKTLYANIAESFGIHRYCPISGTYLQIGVVPYDSLSLFIDTLGSICGGTTMNNGGSPQYSSQKYKLTIIDNCGTPSAMGPFHKSIFHQQNNQNFNWNFYEIENAQPFSDYLFMRDTLGNGNWQMVAPVSGNATTDPDYNLYPNADYRIDALGFNCEATRSTVNTTRSNIRHNAYGSPPLTLNITTTDDCNSQCHGTAQAIVTGGSGPITYFWTPGNFYTPNISGLCPGSYSLEVTDGTDTLTEIVYIYLGGILPNDSIYGQGDSLFAFQNGATYQWLNCGLNYQVIPGATGQSILALPNVSYAVVVTLNWCSDTSNCTGFYIGINEYSGNDAITIFPNPANESITIKNEGFVPGKNTTVKIYDMLGALVYNEPMTSKLMLVNVQSYSKGVYTIAVESNGQRVYKKLVVE